MRFKLKYKDESGDICDLEIIERKWEDALTWFNKFLPNYELILIKKL